MTSLPEPDDGKFGRRDYWDTFYKEINEFSWYSNWSDLEPFVKELISVDDRILVPGVGNDPAIVGMYDAGYTDMVAFDYAPEGVACAERLFGNERDKVEFLIADVRDLDFPESSFDAVFEKGTLDAVYISGGKDKAVCERHLRMAVEELARVVSDDGTVVSISGACIDHVKDAFSHFPNTWQVVRDGSFYMTDEGYATNAVDGAILAWRRRGTNRTRGG